MAEVVGSNPSRGTNKRESMFRVSFKSSASWSRQVSSISEACNLIKSKTKIRGLSDYVRHGFWFGDNNDYIEVIEVATGESAVIITRKKINGNYVWCVKPEPSVFPFVGDDLGLLLKSVFGENL